MTWQSKKDWNISRNSYRVSRVGLHRHVR